MKSCSSFTFNAVLVLPPVQACASSQKLKGVEMEDVPSSQLKRRRQNVKRRSKSSAGC